MGAAWIIFNEIWAPLFFFPNLILKTSDLMRFFIFIEVSFVFFFFSYYFSCWFSINTLRFFLDCFVLFCFASIALKFETWSNRKQYTQIQYCYGNWFRQNGCPRGAIIFLSCLLLLLMLLLLLVKIEKDNNIEMEMWALVSFSLFLYK